MADPIGTFSGLNSGFQWRDMVDQIMRIEQQRRYDPVAQRQSALKSRAEAWKQFQTIASRFREAAVAMQHATAFDAFTASASKSATTGRDLVSISAGAGAAPGTYGIEVIATARAEKIGGAVVADSAAALGITGSFALNGRAITVTADDSLITLRGKINAANAGATPSGVSATILSAAGGSRIVLTSTATGASGIDAIDTGDGTLQALGFTDGTASANIAADGSTQSSRFSSATASVASLIGIAAPASTTIKVGGQTVTVDLSSNSLTTIADAINTATGDASAARVVSETNAGKTSYRLVTNAAVEVDAGAAVDSARALSALGLTRSNRGDVAQTVLSANTFIDSVTGVAATATSLATDIEVNGQSLGIVAGDTITLSGRRGDGTAVTRTLVVGAATTLQDVLNAANDTGTGFGAGTRAATASLNAGRLALTDQVAGDSQLALQMTFTHAGGSAISTGAYSTANGGTTGLSRQISAGADAVIRVDGQVVRRASNVITDAISGVTVTALAAEQGVVSQVTVGHDTDAIVKTMQDFVTAYNAVRSFVTTNSAQNGALANSTALRSMGGTLPAKMLQSVTGITGMLNTASLAGLQHDRSGVLSLNASAFKNALAANFDDVRALFSQTGTTTDAELTFITAGDSAQPSATPYAVSITQAATQATVTGASWTTYVTSGAPDTFSITDGASGTTGSITLADGDSIATVVQKLNTMFATDKLKLTAERTVDDRVTITSTEYGTAGGFTTAFTPGAGGDGTALLGIAAQSFTGLDVAGTIGALAATGKGQILTGTTGATKGLAVRFAGSVARNAGTIALSLGVGGELARAAAQIATDGSGGAATQASAASAQADALDSRLSDIEARLADRRASLIRQFIAMESALAKAQSMGGALTAQLSALQNN